MFNGVMRRGLLGILFFMGVITVLQSPVLAQTADYSCGTYGAGDYSANCAEITVDPQTGVAPTVPSGSQQSLPRTNGSPATQETDAPANTPQQEPTSQRINLNDFDEYSNETGKMLSIRQSQVISFTVGGVVHTITMKVVTDEYVIVTIASTPTDVKILSGQTVDYDVTGDGNADIRITYGGSPTPTIADMTFKQLGSNPTIITDGDSKQSQSWFVVAIIGTVLVVVAAVLIMKRKQKS